MSHLTDWDSRQWVHPVYNNINMQHSKNIKKKHNIQSKTIYRAYSTIHNSYTVLHQKKRNIHIKEEQKKAHIKEEQNKASPTLEFCRGTKSMGEKAQIRWHIIQTKQICLCLQ